jgi:hypothetical protein
MNRLPTAASTAAFGLVTAEPASPITSGARKSFHARYFSYLRFRKAAQLKTDPTIRVDSPVINEESWIQDNHHTPLYDLAASNPHLIATSLFIRKIW